MKIEELIDRGDETGQRIRETLNVLFESPYFYKTDDVYQWHATFEEPGLLLRIGPDRGGHWEVVEP